MTEQTPRMDEECICERGYAAGASLELYCGKHGLVRTDPIAIEVIVNERIRTNKVEATLRREFVAAKAQIAALEAKRREDVRKCEDTGTSWLIEPTKQPLPIHNYIRTCGDREHPFVYDNDVNAALRFARKKDAEAFIYAARIQNGFAVEHIWMMP